MRTRGKLLVTLLLSGCSLIVPSSRDFTYAEDAGPREADGGPPDAGCPDTCDGVCTNLQTDPLHCGSCERACTAPEHATPTCSAEVCDFDCEDGYARVDADCVPVEAPRAIAPLSTALVTSRRPTLRWELAARTEGARIQLCADRGCATVIEEIDAPGTSVRPSAELPPGVVFWRLFGISGEVVGVTPSPVWQIRVGARSADGDVDTSWGM